MKAAKPHGIKKLKMSYDDALLRIERMPEILGISDAPCVTENDPECWHVQVYILVSFSYRLYLFVEFLTRKMTYIL